MGRREVLSGQHAESSRKGRQACEEEGREEEGGERREVHLEGKRGTRTEEVDEAVYKAEAQAGRMRQVLFAVAVKTTRNERQFRAPTQQDLDAIAAATKAGTLKPAAPGMSYRGYDKRDRIQNLWVISLPNRTPPLITPVPETLNPPTWGVPIWF